MNRASADNQSAKDNSNCASAIREISRQHDRPLKYSPERLCTESNPPKVESFAQTTQEDRITIRAFCAAAKFARYALGQHAISYAARAGAAGQSAASKPRATRWSRATLDAGMNSCTAS
jgi:hypothetical protein